MLIGLLSVFLLMLSACGTKTYKVTIDSMNGSEAIVLKLEENKRVNVPVNPEKEGYQFEGWFEGESFFDFNNKVVEDILIYAKWAQFTYTVTFVSNGGTEVAPAIVAHGALLTAPTVPTRENFTFTGWTIADGAFDFSTAITSNLYLYASYEAINYNVMFDTLGGSSVETQSVMAGTVANMPKTPTKDGNRFLGWYMGETEFNFATPITTHTILSAKWMETMYTGYYEGLDGLTGPNLIIFLNNLLKVMTGKDYGFARTALQVTDRDPNNSSKLIEFYTGDSYVAKWDLGVTWNREHVWPQSLLNVAAENTLINRASDLHNLTPANPDINTSRSNKWYGPAITATSYLPERAEVRGDIARILFYMDVRYDELKLVFLTGTQKPAKQEMGDLATLLQWHIDDPVDDFERNRNNVIFGYQNNRNPFIDHPELVSYVYNAN